MRTKLLRIAMYLCFIPALLIVINGVYHQYIKTKPESRTVVRYVLIGSSINDSLRIECIPTIIDTALFNEIDSNHWIYLKIKFN
jgi:hypothetical protein